MAAAAKAPRAVPARPAPAPAPAPAPPDDDDVGRFVREACDRGRADEFRCGASELYRAYDRWCQWRWQPAPRSQTAFGKILAEKWPCFEKRRVGGTYRYYGIEPFRELQPAGARPMWVFVADPTTHSASAAPPIDWQGPQDSTNPNVRETKKKRRRVSSKK
jgi:phage/plasmid-associated DNA primase